jgi:hypothetical protein
MRGLIGILLMVAAVSASSVFAVEAAVASEPEPAVEEVVVTGTQPGPGLWRVTRPTDGHVLWILGSYGPLPKKFQWRSAELEEVLGGSTELIAPVAVKTEVGPLGGVTLLPSLIGVRRNPGGERLQDLLPADLYARWLRLKERYIGRDADVEEWRPIFAAQKLYEEAIRKTGFEPRGVIWPKVEKLAKRADVRIARPEIEFTVAKPRAAIKEFKRESLDDLECFTRTIERLESDLDVMKDRAQAWATGDVARLRALAPVDNASACIAVVLNAQFMRDRGITDLPARHEAAWLGAVEQALDRNASSVAVLGIEQILKPDGYVARLRTRGYVVEDP